MQTVTPEQVIARAATIIADKSHWTTGTEARDSNGANVTVDSPSAVSFCARGAVMRATMELTGQPAVQSVQMGVIQCGCGSCENSVRGGLHPVFIAAMNKLDNATVHGSIVSINDHQGHEMVMQVMSRAQCTVSGTVFAIPSPPSVSYIDTTTTVMEAVIEAVLVEVPKLVEYVPATPPIKATAKNYRDLAIVPEKRTALLASVGVS